MKKIMCGMAMGAVVTVLACRFAKKSCVCEEMVDDLMEKKNKIVKNVKKVLDK